MAVETAEVDIENLQLDPGNPRLAAGVDQSQQAMMEFLTDVIQVQDLIDSILASGFVAADPIIARKEGERYFVIEGNRRLCALRWLVEPSKWTARTPPKLFRQPSEDEKATLRKVKVQLGWNQEDLTAYLAYKHVTSTKEWSPEAKARFVKKHANGDFSDENLRLFAQKTGSKLASLKRWLCALFAVEQAIEANIITEAHANEINFGTFYTYLGGAAVKNFLGIDDDNLRPHSVRNVEHLEEFLLWISGSDGIAPVLTSRDQKDLERILADDRAREYFRKSPSRSVIKALRQTRHAAADVAEDLERIAYELDDLATSVYDHRGDTNVIQSHSVFRNAVQKLDDMIKK